MALSSLWPSCGKTTAPADDDADEGGSEGDDDGAGAEREVGVVRLRDERRHGPVDLDAAAVADARQVPGLAGERALGALQQPLAGHNIEERERRCP